MATSNRAGNQLPQSSPPGEAEDALWRAFRTGDRDAFAELYERYARKLLSYGRKLSPDPQQLEDAIQDLFIELWKSRENLSATTSIQFYLFRALRNKLSRAAQATRSRFGFDPEGEEMPLPEVLRSFSTEATWIAHEEETARLDALQRAIGRLSQRQQEVIHLRYFQQFDNARIAELMGISDQSVRNLIHAAVGALRRVLVPVLVLIINFLMGF